MDKQNHQMKIRKRKKKELPPKAPRKGDQSDQDLILPIEAPEPRTAYDYGKPYYTDANHVKDLLFDDNDVDKMIDQANIYLLESRLEDKEIGRKMNQDINKTYKNYAEEYKILGQYQYMLHTV